MCNQLYFICPTDHLETIINDTFKGENYFYTSLGNSFDIIEVIGHIKNLVQKHHIKKIYIALSNDNEVISDALEGQSFSKVKELRKCYREVVKQKENSKVLWQGENEKHAILSYYLNKKIKELQSQFRSSLYNPVKISGKIYNRYTGTFQDIYPHFICIEQYVLN